MLLCFKVPLVFGQLGMVKDLDPLPWTMLLVLEVRLDSLTVPQMQLAPTTVSTVKMLVSYVHQLLYLGQVQVYQLCS